MKTVITPKITRFNSEYALKQWTEKKGLKFATSVPLNEVGEFATASIAQLGPMVYCEVIGEPEAFVFYPSE